MPAFCSLLLPSYFSKNYAGKIGTSLALNHSKEYGFGNTVMKSIYSPLMIRSLGTEGRSWSVGLATLVGIIFIKQDRFISMDNALLVWVTVSKVVIRRCFRLHNRNYVTKLIQVTCGICTSNLTYIYCICFH